MSLGTLALKTANHVDTVTATTETRVARALVNICDTFTPHY